VPIFVFLAFFLSVAHGQRDTDDRVYLPDISALTFRKGFYTTSRRTSAVPELRCVSGPCHIDVHAVQCRNMGNDGRGNVQWACEADLPNGISLSTIHVNCEGYDGPNDRYILHGSCGLEFGLAASPTPATYGGGSYGSHHEVHSEAEDRILLPQITSLTFQKGKMTRSRRSQPIPQLKCVRGPCHVDVDTVQCRNVGVSDFGEVQWRCSAELPNGVSFARINVNCEGYHNSQDEGVLKGSCGLEYDLKGAVSRAPGYPVRRRHESPPLNSQPHDTALPYIAAAVLLLAVFVSFSAAKSPLLHAVHHHYGDENRPSYTGGGPGFWSGLLGAVGLSWLFRRLNRRPRPPPPSPVLAPSAPPAAPQQPPPLYNDEHLYDDAGAPLSLTQQQQGSPTKHTAVGYGGTTRR